MSKYLLDRSMLIIHETDLCDYLKNTERSSKAQLTLCILSKVSWALVYSYCPLEDTVETVYREKRVGPWAFKYQLTLKV